jgi:membrane protein YdbS with pleckstrin-like domain
VTFVQRLILAAGDRPFTDRDAADLKCDLLKRELGAAIELQVVPHPQGGFAVKLGSDLTKAPATPSKPAQRKISGAALLGADFATQPARAFDMPQYPIPPPPIDTEGQASATEPPATAVEQVTPQRSRSRGKAYPDNFTLQPSPRAFAVQLLAAAIGAFCVLNPQGVFQLAAGGVPENPMFSRVGLTIVSVAGLVTMLMAISRFMTAYLCNSYVISPSSVEQVQWYMKGWLLRRRNPRVQFAHVRAVDVDQGMLQMLLNVGTVRLAAGGTDSYEVELKYIAAPRRLQEEFQRRQLKAVERNEPHRAAMDL